VVVLTAFLAPSLIRSPLLATLGLVLIAASAIDWKIGRLPDVLTGVVAIIGLSLAALISLRAVEIGAGAAAIAFGLLQGLRWMAARGGRDPGLGLGDVKMICALALWLGAATPWMVAGGAVVGLIMMGMVRPPGGRMAFGPSLAAAAWIVGMGAEWGLWPTIV